MIQIVCGREPLTPQQWLHQLINPLYYDLEDVESPDDADRIIREWFNLGTDIRLYGTIPPIIRSKLYYLDCVASPGSKVNTISVSEPYPVTVARGWVLTGVYKISERDL